jgi:hypothetical protein
LTHNETFIFVGNIETNIERNNLLLSPLFWQWETCIVKRIIGLGTSASAKCQCQWSTGLKIVALKINKNTNLMVKKGLERDGKSTASIGGSCRGAAWLRLFTG